STVASRRASASPAPKAGRVRATLSNNRGVAPRGLGIDLQIFITVIVNTTNRLQVRSISSAAGTILPPFVALCALDFATASLEKQWQGVRYFVQPLRRMARPAAGGLGSARSGRTGPIGTIVATNLAAPTIAARPPEDLGRTRGERASSRLLEPRSRP